MTKWICYKCAKTTTQSLIDVGEIHLENCWECGEVCVECCHIIKPKKTITPKDAQQTMMGNMFSGKL